MIRTIYIDLTNKLSILWYFILKKHVNYNKVYRCKCFSVHRCFNIVCRYTSNFFLQRYNMILFAHKVLLIVTKFISNWYQISNRCKCADSSTWCSCQQWNYPPWRNIRNKIESVNTLTVILPLMLNVCIRKTAQKLIFLYMQCLYI